MDMTVEVKAEETGVAVQQEEPVKEVKEVGNLQQLKDVVNVGIEGEDNIAKKTSSYREESNFISDLRDHEKKSLNDLKLKLEEAILGCKIFDKQVSDEDASKEKEKDVKEESKDDKGKTKEESEEKTIDELVASEETKAENAPLEDAEEAKKPNGESQEEEEKDIAIWGIPLLPSKGHEGTDIVLLKFLRARDFKVDEAFTMIKKTLQWRKEFDIDSLLGEDFGADLAVVSCMNGVDRLGHPICYNIFAALDDEELYNKAISSEEKRKEFLRWRVQLMEKGIQKLDFSAGGINSLLQINDLKNSPGPSRREIRLITKQAVALLQDNYPEFVAKNIFINVPFWYYAFYSLLSPFLTLRSKSKFVIARPAMVTETLLKYVPVQEIPIQYGGLKREVDFDFSTTDAEPSELVIKAGATEIIEIPATEVGTTFIWDVTVFRWEVNYKEEFVPTDENSYTIIIQKEKKLGPSDTPIRNTFKNKEPGKILLSILNSSGKKKRAFYRHKIMKPAF